MKMIKKLYFIKDKELKNRIVNSFEYMDLIFKQFRTDKSHINRNETNRVVILYIVSIIEAVLLYIVKEKNYKLTSLVYKYPNEISQDIKHLKNLKEKLVTAVQIKQLKTEQQISIYDLVTFFKNQKLMKEKTADDILNINSIRNTFHLSKKQQSGEIEIKDIEKAFSLLATIIKGAPVAMNL